jgi:hypothetical protein
MAPQPGTYGQPAQFQQGGQYGPPGPYDQGAASYGQGAPGQTDPYGQGAPQFGQPAPFGQTDAYGQGAPQFGQPSQFGQPDSYPQPDPYGQGAPQFGQPDPYAQPDPYGQGAPQFGQPDPYAQAGGYGQPGAFAQGGVPGQTAGWQTPGDPNATGQGAATPPGTYLASDGRYYPLADQSGFGGQGVAAQEPAPPKRKRRGVLVAASVVAALVVAGGGAYAVLALRGGGGGAGSPEDAAEALLQDLASLDYGKIVAHVAPSEQTLLDPVAALAEAQTEQTDQAKEVQAAWNDVKASLTIEFKGLTFASASIAEGVERTAVTGGTLSLDADTDKLTAAVMDFYNLIGESASGAYLDMGTVTESDVREQVEDFFPVTKGVDDLAAAADLEDLFVVTVEEDGKWFASASMTAAQYAYEAAGLDNANLGDPIPEGEMKGGSSPEQALENLVEALHATGSTGDLRELAKALPVAESRLVAVYGPALMGDAGGAGLAALGSLESLTGTKQSDVAGHARITIDSLIVSPLVTLTRTDNVWSLVAGDDYSKLAAELTQDGDKKWLIDATSTSEWNGEETITGSIEVPAKGSLDIRFATSGDEIAISIQDGCVAYEGGGESQTLCGDDLGMDLSETGLNDIDKLPDLKALLALSAVKGAGGDWYISPTASLLDLAVALNDSLK